MMNLSSFFFSALLFTASSALALNGGDWWDKGNGGFALSCPDQKLRTFDLYELQNRYEDTMTLDEKAQDSLNQRVHYLLDKVAALNPARASKYRAWYQDFHKESQFTEEVLQGTPDIGLGQIPESCSLEIVIFQRSPGILNPYRYTIRKAHWNRLSTIDQAALVMHELIYREASEADNQHLTSERSRYLNAWINSLEFSKVSLNEYLIRLQKLRFRDAEYGSHKIYLGRYNTANKSWVESTLSLSEANNTAVVTVDIKDADAARLVSPLLSFCLTKIKAEGQLYLDSAGHARSWQTDLPPGETCSFRLQDFESGRRHGYRGAIQGNQFNFFEQNKFEVIGAYDYSHRFNYAGFRFDLFSPAIRMKHVLNAAMVDKIIIPSVEACRSDMGNFIQLVHANSGLLIFSLEDLEAEIKSIPTCPYLGK